MRIDWDRNKGRSNLRKHGVSFETASLVFEDPSWQTMGLVNGIVVLIVAHTVDGDEGKESFELFRLGRRRPGKGRDIMKASDRAATEATALANLPDSDIDPSDVPERSDGPMPFGGSFIEEMRSQPVPLP